MNWRPKNDTVGVPGKGYIRAADFSEEDLENMKARARNRKIDVNVFLMNAGLVQVRPQIELDLPPVKEELKTEVIGPEKVEEQEPDTTYAKEPVEKPVKPKRKGK